ncbi:hypothetical protein JYU34_006600 [Plutella xylostella]|uniref:Uncharacterized protein n=1 Tax=Plutella xylostella TaxID=51655 RepID=A0ABQ7QSE9_PLUXY|nr:hypothetical protein JYU34_006600 [Plutella xylostella]
MLKRKTKSGVVRRVCRLVRGCAEVSQRFRECETGGLIVRKLLLARSRVKCQFIGAGAGAPPAPTWRAFR